MTFDPDRSTRELRESGLTIIPAAFSAGQCASFVRKLNDLAISCDREGLTDLGGDVHTVWNFFRHDDDLMPLVFNPYMDVILKEVIDNDYVLISANAVNRSVVGDNPRHLSAGDYWHTDSRVIGGRRLDWGFSYIACVMLEPFTPENAATRYIPRSHLDRTTPDRDGDYPYETLTGEAGTMVIFDSGLWHAGGPATKRSRWSVFTMYGPWFLKPYHRFHDMLRHRKDSLSPDLRRLFHFDSTPPIDETEGRATLRRVREREMKRVHPEPTHFGTTALDAEHELHGKE
jgi:hypothetical protein